MNPGKFIFNFKIGSDVDRRVFRLIGVALPIQAVTIFVAFLVFIASQAQAGVRLVIPPDNALDSRSVVAIPQSTQPLES